MNDRSESRVSGSEDRGEASGSWAIAVHGGAGDWDPLDVARAREGCAKAAGVGAQILREGGGALDAVEAAVRALEDDPHYNAGVGSALARDGRIEVDAAIMDGATLRVGAVGAVPNFRNPVALARRVLETGENVLLVGEGAAALARECGMVGADPGDLVTPRAVKKWLRSLADQAGESGGTVGAVACDAARRLAAATSTGGLSGKRPGRVADTAVPGAGTYANGHGAASATGVGEPIIRVLLGRTAVDRMAAGADVQMSGDWALRVLREATGGSAGIILVDSAGRVAAARTTRFMPHAWCTGAGRGEPVVTIGD